MSLPIESSVIEQKEDSENKNEKKVEIAKKSVPLQEEDSNDKDSEQLSPKTSNEEENIKFLEAEEKRKKNARLSAFIQYLKIHKHEIRHHEKKSTKFVCENINLMLKVLQKQPETGLPFLLIQHTEIDTAFANVLPEFFIKFGDMPHAFIKIFSQWIVKYPYRILSAMRIYGFDFFFKNLKVELTSNMFIKLFNLQTKDFMVFVDLLIVKKFFSILFAKLQQNVLKEKVGVTDQDYDYESIHVRSGQRTTSCTTRKKKQTKKTEIREVIDTKIGMLGVIKEFKRVSIDDEIPSISYADNSYSESFESRSQHVSDYSPDYSSSPVTLDPFEIPSECEKERRTIRLNILDVIHSFLEKHDDEYITRKIMKHSSVLLSMFLNETTVHITELNILHSILKTLLSKHNNQIILSHIHKKLNNFSFLFQTFDEMDLLNKNKNETTKTESIKTDVDPDFGETKFPNFEKNSEILSSNFSTSTESLEIIIDESNKMEEDSVESDNLTDENIGENREVKEESTESEITSSKSEKEQNQSESNTEEAETETKTSTTTDDSEDQDINLQKIMNNSIFQRNIKIEFQKNKQRTVEFKGLVEKQLIMLKSSKLSLHLVLKLDFLSFCSRFYKTREILKKQLLYAFFIDIYEHTTNTHLLASFLRLIRNFSLDYEFIYHILVSTNLLRIIIQIGKEQLILAYERHPVRKPNHPFNCDLARQLLKLRNDILIDLQKKKIKYEKNIFDVYDRYSSVFPENYYQYGDYSNEKNNKSTTCKKQHDFKNFLFRLLDRFFSSEDWLLIYDGVLHKEISASILTYDKKSVIDHKESDLPESMWRFYFQNLCADMPFSDIFSEKGI